MSAPKPPSTNEPAPDDESRPGLGAKLRTVLIGPPRDLRDKRIYQHISLIAFLAWVGLGADGLSSSSYGPEEAFKTLAEHTYLAVGLAVLTAFTVMIISAAYSKIIERFPHGGGGYMVASSVLGKRTGVVAGGALLVDYVLTITISIAAAGDATFSLLPIEWQVMKVPVEICFLLGLTVLNMRGVRESVLTMTPVFLLFVVTHLVLIVGAIAVHADQFPETTRSLQTGFSDGLTTLGIGGMLLLFVHAYSLGGGTYTGIEAVSNGLGIMREPRVQTGKRTMWYMAVSLAFTAAGLILCYLLWDVHHQAGRTMNWSLARAFAGDSLTGDAFVIATLVSEGALLVVAAQAGFVGGPRVLANMAIDSWMPHRFAALSDRLAQENGIVLMGLASLGALLYTRGEVSHLVVMYSINVFVTFSLSMLAMLLDSLRQRRRNPAAPTSVKLFAVGLVLCGTILVVTTIEKFMAGGWVTLVVTGALIVLSFAIKQHYDTVAAKVQRLYATLLEFPRSPEADERRVEPRRSEAVAAVLVGDYGGVGLHTCMTAVARFPKHFDGVVFVSVGVVDSKEFKGEGTVEALRESVERNLKKYVAFARNQGIPAAYRYSIDTEAVEGAERLCLELLKEYPRVTFFAGKVIFGKERWYHALLHNGTAYAIQKRLQWAGQMVVVVPVRVT
jgi:amino acid transporter